MKNLRLAVPILMTVLMAGCVVSLHPLYTEKDLVFDPALVGTWVDDDEDEQWSFTRSGDKSYALVMKSKKGAPARFKAQLVQLGAYCFLDILPEELDVTNDYYEFHLIPAHSILRIQLRADSLRRTVLDEDWLRKRISAKKVTIGHEVVGKGQGSRVVLTAPTRQLQALVVQYAEDTEAFASPEEFRRMK